MRELQNQKDNHIPFSEKEWTVGEYLDYWMSDIQTGHIRETTQAAYSQVIKIYIKPTLGNIKLQKLTVHDVRAALNKLHEDGCLGATLQKYYQVLSTCLNCAMREELVQKNVVMLAEKPKYTQKITAIWSAEQATYFLTSIKEHPQYIVFLLLLTYGMRRGEALGLRFVDIDFDNNQIHLRQQIDRINGVIKARDLKTKNSRRVLPLLPNIRSALLGIIKKREIAMPKFNPEFEMSTEGTVVVSGAGTPLEPRNLAKCFERLVKKLGLPRIKIHAMRHTAATILKDLNVPIKDIQLILGHANISTTLNIYQHGTPETQRTALSEVEYILAGNNAVLSADNGQKRLTFAC
jgi:integrase